MKKGKILVTQALIVATSNAAFVPSSVNLGYKNVDRSPPSNWFGPQAKSKIQSKLNYSSGLPDTQDPCEILNLAPETVDVAAIKKAYRKMARLYHPDLRSLQDRQKANEDFAKINEAYEILTGKRKAPKDKNKAGPDNSSHGAGYGASASASYGASVAFDGQGKRKAYVPDSFQTDTDAFKAQDEAASRSTKTATATTACGGFSLGDQVFVKGGEYRGKTGTIISVYPNMVKLDLAFNMNCLVETRNIIQKSEYEHQQANQNTRAQSQTYKPRQNTSNHVHTNNGQRVQFHQQDYSTHRASTHPNSGFNNFNEHQHSSPPPPHQHHNAERVPYKQVNTRHQYEPNHVKNESKSSKHVSGAYSSARHVQFEASTASSKTEQFSATPPQEYVQVEMPSSYKQHHVQHEQPSSHYQQHTQFQSPSSHYQQQGQYKEPFSHPQQHVQYEQRPSHPQQHVQYEQPLSHSQQNAQFGTPSSQFEYEQQMNFQTPSSYPHQHTQSEQHSQMHTQFQSPPSHSQIYAQTDAPAPTKHVQSKPPSPERHVQVENSENDYSYSSQSDTHIPQRTEDVPENKPFLVVAGNEVKLGHLVEPMACLTGLFLLNGLLL
ncbi:hypothetical protein CTEN210_02186 [Chaetoceros tenuissimus]|uniref:J domain-containing protein n=1 Tax=Chaetoceros tenuissimus TaxID=426638 RepID=A0AAD3CGK0_9STRA|nr:hypothetical protein CTEN210_02186 [Chaetoceros tenuissimus]